MGKMIFVGLALFFIGCGDCIPHGIANATSFPVEPMAAPTNANDVVVARSADELRAALGNVQPIVPPQSRMARAAVDPAVQLAEAKQRLDAFVAETSFATTDVALVHAGGARSRLAGATTNGDRVTLYFMGQCSACPGGNPASYEEAAIAADAAQAERTELVRVRKGARVDVRVCTTSCGPCPSNVP